MTTFPRRLVLLLKVALPLSAALLLTAACSSGSKSSDSGAGASSAASSSAPAVAGTIDVSSGPLGSYLVDSGGRAIYLWVSDTNGVSTCTGACASAWPPVPAPAAPTAGTGVTMSELTTITRADGSKQLAYDNHPLYYFVKDTGPGMTTGQGSPAFGAAWWLVSPSGSAITTTTPASSAASSSATSGGGGY